MIKSRSGHESLIQEADLRLTLEVALFVHSVRCPLRHHNNSLEPATGAHSCGCVSAASLSVSYHHYLRDIWFLIGTRIAPLASNLTSTQVSSQDPALSPLHRDLL